MSVFSSATFVAAAVLTAHHRDGPILVLQQQFFVDSLNVFLVTRDRIRGVHHYAVRASVHAHRATTAAMTPPRMRLRFTAQSDVHLHDVAGAADQQHGMLWVAMEAATLTIAGLVASPHAGDFEACMEGIHPCGVGIAQRYRTILLYRCRCDWCRRQWSAGGPTGTP